MTHGFDHNDMMKLNIGPVIFHEHIHYFREVLPGQSVYVTLALKGLSKDGMFFEFEHNIYAEDGTHHIYTELMGGFIDLRTRKLTILPEELIGRVFDDLERTDDFKWLTKDDTRKHQKKPKNQPGLFGD
jgi:acyl-CoA thioester hydrolase